MKLRIFFLSVIASLIACTDIAAADATLGRDTLAKLTALTEDHALVVTAFPAGPERLTTVRFERTDVYAPGAHIYVIGAAGKTEVPHSNLIFLRGYSDDDSVRVTLALNPDGSFDSGSGDGPDGSFVLSNAITASGTGSLAAKPLETAIPAGVKLNYTCGNEMENLDARSLNQQLARSISSGAVAATTAASHALRIATVAVDTDSDFMSTLFSNNATNAANWIAKMFNAMNTMYERDLLVNLKQGTTILRTNAGTDPYASGGAYPVTAFPANGTDLNNFGSNWAANQSGVTRTFATLLSGKGQCSSCGGGTCCSASGIAWVGSYCQKASNGGSYSLVMVYPNISFDPNAATAARLDGHELGHNFGADHTHCTDATSGASPVATNTIDQCFNNESASGCYAGATSCPASGPGAPAGTIMSYCNVKGCNGGQNVLQFHPTQINKVLLPDITSTISNQSGCLNTSDDIFYDGFE